MSDFEMVLNVVTDDGTRIRRRLDVDVDMLIDDDEGETRIDVALDGFAEEISTALDGAKGRDAVLRLRSLTLSLDRLP